MSLSFATITPANLELSPVRVKYKGIDLGATLGNATIAIEAAKAEIKADQLGSTVIDRRISGHKFMITTEIAEIKNKDNWKVVFPYLHEVTSGMNKGAFFDAQISFADTTTAGQLILHPLALPDADLSGDFLFYSATPEGKSELVYGPSGQVKMKTVWNVLPDFSTTPAKFMFYGDPSIGLIAAMFASPVYTGTGNGTLTGEAVFSGFTKTETITATCIHPQVGAGIFNVNGSLSGPLGLATVNVTFNSPVISFKINSGGTDFVSGDNFVLGTTAANYV